MNQDEITALFDKQAPHYDAQWTKTAAIRDCLHYLLESQFAGLPAESRILCVGVGTGAELVHLAAKNPTWRFTVVEPSVPMLERCRERAEREGFSSRCVFHGDYLESLPATEPHDGATCFLVSQFILGKGERARFFQGIAARLKSGGLLASADLASDVASPEYDVLLHAWMSMMADAQVSDEAMERMRHAYQHDVGILAPERIAAIIRAGGFELPVQFFQAGLIHAWVSKRIASDQ